MSDGLVENYYEIYNLDNKVYEDLTLSHSFYYDLSNTYLPYNDKVVKNSGFDSRDFDYWNNIDITENWLLAVDKDGSSRAVIWPEGKKLNFNGWYMSIDFEVGDLKKDECYKSESLFIVIDNFDDWTDLRKFALKDNNPKKLKEENDFYYEINENNPFVENKFEVKFSKNNNEMKIEVDKILIAVGRKPIIKEVGLDKVGIDYNNKRIQVNNRMETNIDNIYAVGDVRNKVVRQVITAAGDGATAAVMAQGYIEEEDYYKSWI